MHAKTSSLQRGAKSLLKCQQTVHALRDRHRHGGRGFHRNVDRVVGQSRKTVDARECQARRYGEKKTSRRGNEIEAAFPRKLIEHAVSTDMAAKPHCLARVVPM